MILVCFTNIKLFFSFEHYLISCFIAVPKQEAEEPADCVEI